jgi:methylated-DNA-[protein]-cysteine S-methyltransferase
MSKRFDEPFWRTNIETPIGPLGLTANADGLAEIWFGGYSRSAPAAATAGATAGAGERDPAGVLERACAQIGEYFAGTRMTFDLPLAPSGTEFELGVWQLNRRIPAGQTASYGDLAG